MKPLAEVEEARAIMTEAAGWSVVKWLREKKRVRKVADRANAALDALNLETKGRWSAEVQSAFELLMEQPRGGGQEKKPAIDPDVALFAMRVRRGDEEAQRARMDAEKTFDEAERLLSTRVAREGCRKAIESWDLHERAIRMAENGIS